MRKGFAQNSPTKTFIDSFAERQKRLAINLLYFQMAVTFGYFIFVLFSSSTFTKYFLPSLMISTAITFSLWMRKRYQSAIVFDLVALNILLFLLSERVPVSTGVDLYYVAIGSATIALFGYEYWRAGVAFAILSLILFLATRFFTFEALPERYFSELQKEVIFLINSIAVAGVSVYSIITVMKINHDAQKSLVQVKNSMEFQNLELKKTNEELDRFVYSASHDLRSPLSSIKGLVNVFEVDPEGKKEEYLPKIKSRIETMEKFIKEITDYSRNTRVQVAMEYIVLKPLVEEIVSSLKYSDGADHLEFQIELEEDFVVRSDPYRLRIILNNLISNSIKYADTKKDKPYVLIKASKDTEVATIEVIDNGIGILNALHEKVFNMFFRATEKSSGSGLGLYIVSESVKKLSGEIVLNSELGYGTTITLKLPQT